MKKLSILTALAASALFATGAAAQETSTDPANCGLNARQVEAGWTCTQEVETTNVSREIAGGSRCQDATITTTTYRSYNPSGNLAEDRTVVVEPEEADWGPSYVRPASGCTYDLIGS